MSPLIHSITTDANNFTEVESWYSSCPEARGSGHVYHRGNGDWYSPPMDMYRTYGNAARQNHDRGAER